MRGPRADAEKPYAHLFTDADRAAASKRLAPHIEAIESRKAASTARIEATFATLPEDVEELQGMAANATGPEEAIAINTAILQHDADDVVAMNRLGRAYEAMGLLEQAKQTFQQAIAADPDNAIAIGRLRDLVRSQRR